MPRRKTQQGINWKLLILIIALPIAGLVLIAEYIGWTLLIIGIALIIGLIFMIRQIGISRRRSALVDKYGDEELVRDIEQGYYWQGQTAEQLRDALGDPDDIDEKVLKTKIKSVWKYYPQGVNRYGLRVKLDDAVVTGWDQKD